MVVAGISERRLLPALLSQAFVAFTIEADNEFEHRVPHRLSRGESREAVKKPWLVSMAMWWHFLQYVPEDGITVRELKQRTGYDAAHLRQWVKRLSAWWGYLTVDMWPGGAQTSVSEAVIRPTPGGLKAIAVWRGLSEAIERRWRERFGDEEIDGLRDRLGEVVKKGGVGLPDCLPILGYGLLTAEAGSRRELREAPEGEDVSGGPLPALLAKALLLFAVEFEREAKSSLAICANVLRVVDCKGTPVHELPRLSGVSKEGIRIAVNFLKSKGYAMEIKSPGSKMRLLLLKAEGELVRADYFKLSRTIETRWKKRFGADTVEALRAGLERLAGGARGKSRLLECAKPYPEGWRARVPEIAVLPHFPMILHRGGYPDGS
jgi:hypothetical protein